MEDHIEVETSKAEAFAAMAIILEAIVADGTNNDDFDDADQCLTEMYRINDQNLDERITQSSDNFLSTLQLNEEYTNICRLFRYYYGYGIYNHKDYYLAVAKMKEYIKKKPEYKEYETALDYASRFFDDKLDILLISKLRILTSLSLDAEYMYLSFNILDYIDYFLE